MKEVVKKIIRLLEKIFDVKSTRNLVIDTTNQLYEENVNLKKNLEQLILDHIELRKKIENKDESKNSSLYDDEFVLANDIWRRNGATHELKKRLDYLAQSSLAWKNCPHEVWLIYLSVLLELGDTDTADNIWKKYIVNHEEQLKWLHRYILVSKYAITKGIDCENGIVAARIYDEFMSSRAEKKIENLLLNAKSIAIVGNGPSERGLNHGMEIDEHEIVIRFNNFTTYGFEADYGKKTDVWVKCSNDDIKHERYIYNYKLILYEADYLHHPLEYNYHKIIYHDMEQNIEVDYLDFDLHTELRNLLGIFPSTGLLVVWLIAKLGILYKTDIYGFSFLQKTVDSYASHYFNDRNKVEALKKSSHHDFQIESQFILDLYNGKYEDQYHMNDLMNEKIYKYFMGQKHKREKLSIINTVHSITHRPFSPNGGSGGGGAVLSCQKILLGNMYGSVKCKYTFFESNKYTKLKGLCDLHDLWGGAYFAIEKTKDENDAVYITHDYGTAFGLFLLGKRYAYVSHLQGPRLEEKTNFGEKYTEKSAQIIKECEKMVFENAAYVCFPSKGAQVYFENSKYQLVSSYNLGPVLYNTLYADPGQEPILDIKQQEDMITVMSVGQLTYAKGIDQCVELVDNLLNNSMQKVRWIIVGKGPYKERIEEQCKKIREQNDMFSYFIIEKCEYRQMQYLQNISDIYMMLQRISIFDLTTLEMMKKGKIVVLSNIGGNPEFNRDNNIILYNGNQDMTVKEILQEYKSNGGAKNIAVYNNCFSNEKFVEKYHILIDKLITFENTSL